MKTIVEQAREAKAATIELRKTDESDRKTALKRIAQGLRNQVENILSQNQKDCLLAEKNGLSDALIDRLRLSEERVASISDSVEQIAGAPAVVNQLVGEFKRDDGLVVSKETIPLGVIGFIFESRPNVSIDASALAIKSGNAIILKGGKEVFRCSRM